MKFKVFVAIILSFLLSSCTTTEKILSDNKIYEDMSKSELRDLFIYSTAGDDPFFPDGGSEFFADHSVEIIWPSSKKLFYVFKNVSEQRSCGVMLCKVGNGTLKSWHNSLNEARASLPKTKKTTSKITNSETKTKNKSLTSPTNEKAFVDAALSIDAVLDASFVSSSSFFMVVDYVAGMDWNKVAEYMCGGRSKYGLGSKYFGITVFNTNKSKVGKAYCK